MNICDSNLKLIQDQMKKDGIKSYLVFASDNNICEYTHPYFLKERLLLSSFTGSDGTLLVTQDKAYLYTDGRYFTQANIELKGTNTELVKMGEEGVPTIYEFIKENKLEPLYETENEKIDRKNTYIKEQTPKAGITVNSGSKVYLK